MVSQRDIGRLLQIQTRDFQTRRGNIRFKIDGQKGYPHSISATDFVIVIFLYSRELSTERRIRSNSEKLVPFMDGMRPSLHLKDVMAKDDLPTSSIFTVEIEVTNHCNAKCSFCPHQR